MHNETFYTKKEINEFKIAIISDIHYYQGYNQKIFDKIIKQLNENHPNYITIAGDILDNSSVNNLKQLKDFITNISKIATTFVIIGNHDEKEGYMHNWKYNKNTELIDTLNSINNLYYLNDKSITINNLNFYGFNLSYKHYEEDYETYESFCNEIKNIHPALNNTNYNITLIHSPINIYKFIQNNPTHSLNKSDLILSGHMHNGCLPFFISHFLNKIFKTSRGILSPTKKLFPKYAQGIIYDHKKIIKGYVYEGITKLSHSTKLFSKFDFIFQKNVEFITIKKAK